MPKGSNRDPEIKHPFVLLHGYNGSGKSTLAHTMPGPIFSIDGEGRSTLMKGRDVWTYEDWDEEGRPRLKPSSVVVYEIGDFEDFINALNVLESYHPFKSAVVDSLLVIQEYARYDLAGADPDDIRSWKEGNFESWAQLKFIMIASLKRLNKLTLPERDNPIAVTVVGPTNRDDSKPRRPDVDGSLGQRLVGIFDIQGAVTKERDPDIEEGEYPYIHSLVIDVDDYETDDFEVKCNVDGIVKEHGIVISEPNLTEDIYNIMVKETSNGK